MQRQTGCCYEVEQISAITCYFQRTVSNLWIFTVALQVCVQAEQYLHQVLLFKEKTEELLMSVALKGNLSERSFFFLNLDGNSTAEGFGKLRLQARLFSFFWEKGCGASQLRNTTTLHSYLQHYNKTCWFKIRVLKVALVLSVEPSHTNSPEKAVSDMVCWLPLKHGNSKLQTTLLAFGPPTQILTTWLPYVAPKLYLDHQV